MHVGDNAGASTTAEEATRVILHLDLDCFYAQVEHERLGIPHSEPLAVQQWGSLLAVNYAARPFGVTRSENIGDARKKCPSIHLPHVETLGDGSEIAPNRSKQKAILRRYRVASRQVFQVIAQHAPLYEKASIDEVYMDVTQQCLDRLEAGTSDGLAVGATHVYGVEDGSFPTTRHEKLLCIGAEIAQEIRDDIQRTLHFTTSVGIATNKLLAKLASPQHKPDGQTMIPPRSVHLFMQSFRVDKIRGLGGKLGKRLLELATPGATNAESSSDHKPKVTAGAIVDEFGLPGLQKIFGEDTGRFIYTLCVGEDGNDPVNTKKVLLAQLNSVKSFEQRTGYLTSEPMFQYWLRILSEEMVWRFDEERDENQRAATQFTLSCDRSDRQKKIVRHFAVPSKVDAASFYAAAAAQIADVSTVLPCAHVVLTAKDFVSTLNPSIKITHFFKETTGPTASGGGAAAAVVECFDTTENAAGGGGVDATARPPRSSGVKLTKPPATTAPSIKQFFSKAPTTDGHGFFCSECNQHVQTTAAEHADHHMALALSSQWNDHEEQPKKKRTKQGPMDFFMKKL